MELEEPRRENNKRATCVSEKEQHINLPWIQMIGATYTCLKKPTPPRVPLLNPDRDRINGPDRVMPLHPNKRTIGIVPDGDGQAARYEVWPPGEFAWA